MITVIVPAQTYQYGYEVGSAPSSILDASAKESSAIALGRYPVKDSVAANQQVEDVSGHSASAFRSGLVSDSALRVEQGRSSQVFFEPKTPEKEEESSLVTSYEIPRASAIPVPKKSAEDTSAGGEQSGTVFSQPNKNERRIVVTSKGSLPITQRQQKRVSQAQKSETSQERAKTYHARTFPKAQRTPQYRPTQRPQYKHRTTLHPTPASVVDYESKQVSTEQSARGVSQASQVAHQSPPSASLTSQESFKQEHRAAAGYQKRPQLTQRPSTGNTYEIRTPHSTQYVSIGSDAAEKAAARYQHYQDQHQQQQEQPQTPPSTSSAYNSYASSSYQSTTPVQSDQTNQGAGYSTAAHQDTYANQEYRQQDVRSVTVGASAQVSDYNQGTAAPKNEQGQPEYHRGTAYPARPQQHYGQAHSLGKTTTRSNAVSGQPEPLYSKPAPPPLRSSFRATPKPDHQQGGGQLPLPPPQPTPPPQDAQKIPLMQPLHFLGAAGPNQPLRVPIIEVASPLLNAGNLQQQGPHLHNLRQEIQRQLQQLNQPHQQPFLFGQPQDAIQQMLKSHQLYVPQNQGIQKVITQGPVPIELKVEPLFDVNHKGTGDGGGIKDVRIQALKPIPLPASPVGHGPHGGANDVPFEVNMLVDAAKKAIMSAGGFPKPEVIVVDGSQSQQKSHADQAFPAAASVKLNDKLNVQVAGLLVDSHSLQSVFPKNLIHGTGSSKLRYNEPVNVHIPNKLAALAKGDGGGNNFAGSSFPANLFQGVQNFGPGGGAHQGQKEGLLLGGSAQEPAFGIGPVRLGEKVSLMDGAGGTLQIADLPQFDPAALAAAATDMIQFRPL
ncbi:hypothetical protein HPB49_024007 [Dermacentor silvarum]|uniref:Uncharacterized protein n=1 Tax=Dermacentor silvarum TaxID=543639 RepID=A0ACB8CC86_DERSI|nr:hypothetical protein HPB49_024007 [Dermacentor silvarum]